MNAIVLPSGASAASALNELLVKRTGSERRRRNVCGSSVTTWVSVRSAMSPLGVKRASKIPFDPTADLATIFALPMSQRSM